MIAEEEEYNIGHLNRLSQPSKDIGFCPFLTKGFWDAADHGSVCDATRFPN